MSAKAEVEMMTCTTCGLRKAWQDGFPDHIYAECWSCACAAHMAKHHPPKRRLRARWPFYRVGVDR